MAIFDARTLTSSPLTITFFIGPQGSIDTTVNGESRNSATIFIKSGSMPVYTGSMNQVAPNLEAPSELILGDLLMKNATFKLTIPTSQQNGSVFMTATFKTGDNPEQPIKAIIATWPLTS